MERSPDERSCIRSVPLLQIELLRDFTRDVLEADRCARDAFEAYAVQRQTWEFANLRKVHFHSVLQCFSSSPPSPIAQAYLCSGHHVRTTIGNARALRNRSDSAPTPCEFPA